MTGRATKGNMSFKFHPKAGERGEKKKNRVSQFGLSKDEGEHEGRNDKGKKATTRGREGGGKGERGEGLDNALVTEKTISPEKQQKNSCRGGKKLATPENTSKKTLLAGLDQVTPRPRKSG